MITQARLEQDEGTHGAGQLSGELNSSENATGRFCRPSEFLGRVSDLYIKQHNSWCFLGKHLVREKTSLGKMRSLLTPEKRQKIRQENITYF